MKASGFYNKTLQHPFETSPHFFMENNSSNYSPSSFFNIFKQPNCTLRFALHWLMSQRQERQMVWQMWLLCMPPRPGNLTCADWIFLSAEAFACPVLAVLTCSCLHVASSSTPLRFGAVKANLFFLPVWHQLLIKNISLISSIIHLELLGAHVCTNRRSIEPL